MGVYSRCTGDLEDHAGSDGDAKGIKARGTGSPKGSQATYWAPFVHTNSRWRGSGNMGSMGLCGYTPSTFLLLQRSNGVVKPFFSPVLSPFLSLLFSIRKLKSLK